MILISTPHDLLLGEFMLEDTIYGVPIQLKLFISALSVSQRCVDAVLHFDEILRTKRQSVNCN